MKYLLIGTFIHRCFVIADLICLFYCILFFQLTFYDMFCIFVSVLLSCSFFICFELIWSVVLYLALYNFCFFHIRKHFVPFVAKWAPNILIIISPMIPTMKTTYLQLVFFYGNYFFTAIKLQWNLGRRLVCWMNKCLISDFLCNIKSYQH